MKINCIQLSNILSFKYYPDVTSAPKIFFEEGLNILIGQNGSGKSTVLEVINFVFKKVIFRQYNLNYNNYFTKDSLDEGTRKEILRNVSVHNYRSFRLEPNWQSETEEQKILIEIALDEIDESNLKLLSEYSEKLNSLANKYSSVSPVDFSGENKNKKYTIEITLDRSNQKFSTEVDIDDAGYQYLLHYNYYKELIDIYNQENEKENPKEQLLPLRETFTLIGGYRNYNSFLPNISLSSKASILRQNLKSGELEKSANATDLKEPTIFGLVRLRLAERHQTLTFTAKDQNQVELEVNQEPFVKLINAKLSLINLEAKIVLTDRNTWEYSFTFYDTKTNRALTNIDSLSAGQKSIIHLIFESYGRDELKGGVVIIDEPEIHLHYQYQYEYLKIIKKLNAEQKCQYILVTHSEALISSDTISKVKRFSLDENKNTTISSPKIEVEHRALVKILDNTRSTYAFFARKVVLVEGDTDRYFFKSVFQALKPDLNQEIAIIDVGGKGNFENWRSFFTCFGLKVYTIGDFDNVITLKSGPSSQKIISEADWNKAMLDKLKNIDDQQKLKLVTSYNELIKDPDFLQCPSKNLWDSLVNEYQSLVKQIKKECVSDIKLSKPDIEHQIESQYCKGIFILKKGDLETYTEAGKLLKSLVPFCDNISQWLSTDTEYTVEIKNIIDLIAKD